MRECKHSCVILLGVVGVSGFDVEGAFAYAIAEVVELGATHLATAGDFDLGNTRCVQGENPLNTFA